MIELILSRKPDILVFRLLLERGALSFIASQKEKISAENHFRRTGDHPGQRGFIRMVDFRYREGNRITDLL
jgi:hypothetical protein